MLEIGRYDDSVEPVPTEEEAAVYLEQLALEEEEEQILLSRFSGEEDIGDWYVFRVMKYKSFHNTNRENKRYDLMCLHFCLPLTAVEEVSSQYFCVSD